MCPIFQRRPGITFVRKDVGQRGGALLLRRGLVIGKIESSLAVIGFGIAGG